MCNRIKFATLVTHYNTNLHCNLSPWVSVLTLLGLPYFFIFVFYNSFPFPKSWESPPPSLFKLKMMSVSCRIQKGYSCNLEVMILVDLSIMELFNKSYTRILLHIFFSKSLLSEDLLYASKPYRCFTIYRLKDRYIYLIEFSIGISFLWNVNWKFEFGLLSTQKIHSRRAWYFFLFTFVTHSL